jgi:hypothetical protein
MDANVNVYLSRYFLAFVNLSEKRKHLVMDLVYLKISFSAQLEQQCTCLWPCIIITVHSIATALAKFTL